MKRFFCLLFALLLFPLVSFADFDPNSSEPYVFEHYYFFIDGRSINHEVVYGYVFDFDSFSFDLFLSSDQKTGYILETRSFSGVFVSSGLLKVSVKEIDGTIYLTSENGDFLTVTRDENGLDLWVDLPNGCFRLRPVIDLSTSDDWR